MEYERLTERVNKGQVKFILKDGENPIEKFQNALNRLAELEDKIEQGTLIELPCKLGDTVYQTDGVRVYQGEIIEISLTPKHFIFTADIVCFDERAIGTRVFLTREEAEKRLKEMQE